VLISEIGKLRGELTELKREKTDLLLEIERLRRELVELKREKTDLELLMETNIEHSDFMTEDLLNKVESALRENERRFRLISETIPVPIMVSRVSDGTILYANEPASHLLGLPVSMLLGRKTIDFFLYRYADERESLLNILETQGYVSNYELRGKSADGTLFWVILSAQSLRFNEVPCVLGAFYDLTERKTAEEELLRLATAVEHAAEGILITEKDGTIRYVNPAFERITGYQKEEINGQNFHILDNTERPPIFYENIRNIIFSGKVWAGHIINKNKKGKTFELEVTISPIKDKPDQIISFVAVSRDVTHEVRMEKQLRQAQKMEAIGTLAGGIAHDFNNILSGIMGYAELAFYGIPEGSKARSQIEKALTACRRAADLVRQILAFSRQTEHEMKPVYMVALVKEALKLLRASLPATIEIRQNIATRSGMIMADPTQIHQVIMNLCTNAAHAMSEKGGILEVSLTDVKITDLSPAYKDLKPGLYLIISVKDTGTGMDISVKERIFEPFFTTKEPGKGTGMGLAMTHRIVENHGGAIVFYSEPGQGTVFQVFFPEIERPVRRKEESLSDKALSGNERILFVDDEETLAELGREVLETLGYKVVNKKSSMEALETFVAAPENFDLVITDQTMPKMTGLELAEKLLAIRSDIPIILCSGFSEAITGEKLKAVGISEFMMKPFTKDEISRAIRSALEKRRVFE